MSVTKWFGRGRPPGPDGDEVPVPVGIPCLWCDEPIAPNDCGVTMPHVREDRLPGHERRWQTDEPWHQECLVRSILGSVGHLEGKCSCFRRGESKEESCEPPAIPPEPEDDPPNMTKHEAAWAACVTAIRLGKLPALWRRQG